jgi:hypothetical protein
MAIEDVECFVQLREREATSFNKFFNIYTEIKTFVKQNLMAIKDVEFFVQLREPIVPFNNFFSKNIGNKNFVKKNRWVDF